MLLGIVSGVGRGMGVLDGGDDRRRARISFVGEFGAFNFITNMDFATRLFPDYFGQDLLSLLSISGAYFAPEIGANYYDEYICLSVCLSVCRSVGRSVRSHISKTT